MKRFIKTFVMLMAGLLILSSGWAAGVKYDKDGYFSLYNYTGDTIVATSNTYAAQTILNNNYYPFFVPAYTFITITHIYDQGADIGNGNFPGNSSWAVYNQNGKVKLVRIR